MGIFDQIKKAIDIAATPAPPRRSAPSPRRHEAPPDPRIAALEQAQRTRREQPVQSSRRPRAATAREMERYERLERAVVVAGAGYPFSEAQVREVLARKGFDAAHVEKYLRSPAARKLLG